MHKCQQVDKCVCLEKIFFILLNIENTDREILRSTTANKKWIVVHGLYYKE